MKIVCEKDGSHKSFIRESYDDSGARVNVEMVDEHGRFFHDRLDLYTGDVTYRYICAQCGEAAFEAD